MNHTPEPFIRACWYVAAWSTEVTDKPLAVRIGNDPVVLYRGASGQVHALENRCPHRMAPLSMGRVEGELLRCMYHGATFKADGHCAHVPGQDTVPSTFKARPYAAIERDGWIWIWLGDADKADPALLPVSELTQPAWRYKTGHLDYAANYELLNDNLTDFSHVTFVHEQTFAMLGAETWANTKPNVTNIDRGVRIERWIENSRNLPFLDHQTHPMVDVWSSYQYVLPGVLLMHGSFWPTGTAARLGRQAPTEGEPLHATYNAQAVTPTGPTSSRYFYGVGVRTVEAPHLPDIVFDLTTAAFHEDQAMIEAQQEMILQSPGVPLRGSSHDQAVFRLRRLVQQELAA